MEFAVYETVCDEAEEIVSKIKNLLSANASIAVCFSSRKMPHFPMIFDKLDHEKITYADLIGRPPIIPSYSAILAIWQAWQTDRSVSNFCRFCAELVSAQLLPLAQLEKIIYDCSNVQSKCLSDNYDLVLEFANLKNIHSFDVVEKYDIHGENFSSYVFTKNFVSAFRDILPVEIIDKLEAQAAQENTSKKLPKGHLIEQIISIVTENRNSISNNEKARVSLLSASDPNIEEHSHVFVVGMTTEYFNSNEKFLNQTALKCCNLHFSYSKKLYCRNILTQEPAKIFSDLFFLFCGRFFSKKEEENLLQTGASAHKLLPLPKDDEKEVNICAKSYLARHDLSKKIHDYGFAIDKRTKPQIACKSFEYLLKNPHIGFYDSVLKLPTMPWLAKNYDRKITIGSLVHEFLQITSAEKNFIKKPPLEVFTKNIRTRANRLKTLFSRACAAADLDQPTVLFRIINTAATLAERILSRLFFINEWKSFASEFPLPKNLTVNLGDEEVELSGRIDLLISNQLPTSQETAHSSTIIIDFKTGKDTELTENNVKYVMQKYSSLQLLLYGIAMQTIGVKDVKIMLLKPDSNELTNGISVNYILSAAPELITKIARVIKTGIIERQILGKNFSQYFVDKVPLSTTDLY